MYFGKQVRIFLKGPAKKAFLELKKRNDKESQSILNSIEEKKQILMDNPQFGDPIKKELIPRNLKKQGIQNLYRIGLSNYWRMIYTIEGTQIEIFLFVLSIMDHKDYNKLFKYKKK